MPKEPSSRASVPEEQVTVMSARYGRDAAKIMQALRGALRKRFPSENELVYDYGRSVVISFAPTERGAEAIVGLSLDANGVRMFVNHGATLPDPHGLLKGKAGQVRYIGVDSARSIARPEVEALMAAAEQKIRSLVREKGRGALIIKPSGGKAKAPAKKTATKSKGGR